MFCCYPEKRTMTTSWEKKLQLSFKALKLSLLDFIFSSRRFKSKDRLSQRLNGLWGGQCCRGLWGNPPWCWIHILSVNTSLACYFDPNLSTAKSSSLQSTVLILDTLPLWQIFLATSRPNQGSSQTCKHHIWLSPVSFAWSHSCWPHPGYLPGQFSPMHPNW